METLVSRLAIYSWYNQKGLHFDAVPYSFGDLRFADFSLNYIIRLTITSIVPGIVKIYITIFYEPRSKFVFCKTTIPVNKFIILIQPPGASNGSDLCSFWNIVHLLRRVVKMNNTKY